MIQTHLQQLIHVVTDVIVLEGGVEDLEIGVVDVLENEAWRLGLRVAATSQRREHECETNPRTINHGLASSNL